ncbi:hypothetical protein MKW92_033785, partial [Papaver armeniacum]
MVESGQGHNIQRFDCVRIKEAFADIGWPCTCCSDHVLISPLECRWHRSLADYFGLGQQKHRSLADVRMNLEVLKHCATVLFLVFPNPLLQKSKQNFKFSNKNEGETSSRKSLPPLGIQKQFPR